MNVKLSEFVKGRVYWEHLSDIPFKKIPKSFETNFGKWLKMRVLNINPLKKILELTLKESIVKGKKKMLETFDNLEYGKKFTGHIVG